MRTIIKNISIVFITTLVVIMTYNEQSFPTILNIAYLIWNITALTIYCYTIYKEKHSNTSYKMLMSITSLVYFPDFSFSSYIILMNFGLFLLLSFSYKKTS